MAWSTRGAKVVQQLKEIGADLVFGQEINGATHTNTIIAGLKPFIHMNDRPGDNDGWFDGKKISQVRTAKSLDLRGDGGADLFIAFLEADGIRFNVFNNHMPSGNFPAREAVAAKVADLLKSKEYRDTPTIVCGDFNNDTYYEGGPHQVLEAAGVKWMKKTVEVENADYAEFYGDFKPKKDADSWLSDIGIFGPNIELLSARLVVTDDYVSDHAPLVAKFRITE